MWKLNMPKNGKLPCRRFVVIDFPFSEGAQCVQNEITKLLPVAKRIHETSDVNYNLHDLIPYVTISLHLISRRNKIDSTKAKCLNNINLLLCQLTTWMGWPAP